MQVQAKSAALWKTLVLNYHRTGTWKAKRWSHHVNVLGHVAIYYSTNDIPDTQSTPRAFGAVGYTSRHYCRHVWAALQKRNFTILRVYLRASLEDYLRIEFGFRCYLDVLSFYRGLCDP